ncbi:TonB-dependent siderophore receptor [Tranquillimonas alkanivorans]|uniref:Iron complex outermembrane recepter protein n=1 Tax=Tranquillimonas alkanivorans TaxID=441119 RepID=A0A1I5THG9_9RHOB|nr:TonB-dependent siderophore receptor [Tranquillimonas alkanivorans]SFP82301.1 iron complex outermembrane recepter protein [Tranquillimonas alkanivorans]
MFTRKLAVSGLALLAACPAMAQDVIELETITVEGEAQSGIFGESVALDTGSVLKTGTPIVETPRSVDVVTTEEIQRRGATDVEEALSYATGVQAGEYGLDNRSDWYLIRGFRPTTYHDGLPSRFGYYNDTKPEPFLIDSIEVLRGPASGLYGNGEVGGVVNTTSKVAGDDAPNLVQLQFGSYERKQIGVDWSGQFSDDVSWRMVGLVREAETQVDYSRDDAIALAPSLTWDITPDTKLTLLGTYQKNEGSPLIQFASLYGTLYAAPDFASGRYLPDDVFVGEPDFDRFDTEQRSATVLFEHRFNNVWSVEANARVLDAEADYDHAWWAYDNYATLRYNPDGTINRTVYGSDRTLETFAVDARTTAEYTLGTVEMRTLFGASYTRASYDNDYGYGSAGPIDPFDPVYTGVTDVTVDDYPTSTTEERNVYVQNRATFGGRLSIDAGLAWGEIETGETTGDFSDATINSSDDEVTANIAAIYNFDNGLAPYVSYAESFRQEALGTDAQGNQFEPTKGEQYEIGVKYQPVGTNALFSVAAFDLTKSNLLVDDPDNQGFQVQTGEATVRGLEFEAKTGWRDFTLDAGFTVLDHENEDGHNIATVPDRFGSLWLGYRPTDWGIDGMHFGVGVRYNGEKWDGTDTQETPSYTLYDAAVGYETDRYDVTLSVRNIGDERHMTFCGTAACYFGEGRSALLTATAKF